MLENAALFARIRVDCRRNRADTAVTQHEMNQDAVTTGEPRQTLIDPRLVAAVGHLIVFEIVGPDPGPNPRGAGGPPFPDANCVAQSIADISEAHIAVPKHQPVGL